MAVTKFVQNGLVRLAYDVAGEGTPVVLLHGLLGDRTTMRPLADALADGHRVVSIDLRGHGGSSAIHGTELSLDDLAGDIVAVMDQIGIGTAAVVGVDLGAEIAAHMGNRASSVVAVNPIATLNPDAETLAGIADAAYKGLGEKAVHGWLDIAWGDGWSDRVPRARIAAARRNAGALHACLGALADGGYASHTNSLTLPGGTPFGEDADLQTPLTAVSNALSVG